MSRDKIVARFSVKHEQNVFRESLFSNPRFQLFQSNNNDSNTMGAIFGKNKKTASNKPGAKGIVVNNKDKAAVRQGAGNTQKTTE
jgi:hypothetical protein